MLRLYGKFQLPWSKGVSLYKPQVDGLTDNNEAFIFNPIPRCSNTDMTRAVFNIVIGLSEAMCL